MSRGRPRKRRYYFSRLQDPTFQIKSNVIPLNEEIQVINEQEDQVSPDCVSNTVKSLIQGKQNISNTMLVSSKGKQSASNAVIPLNQEVGSTSNAEQLISGNAIGIQENSFNQARPVRASKLKCHQKISEITQIFNKVRSENISFQAFQRRARESPEKRIQRLADLRQRASMRIARESAEERLQRLEKQRQHASMRLERESIEERVQRLAKLRQRASMRHARESMEERIQRLAKQRQQASIRQALESAQERQQHLEEHRHWQARYRKALQSKSVEQSVPDKIYLLDDIKVEIESEDSSEESSNKVVSTMSNEKHISAESCGSIQTNNCSLSELSRTIKVEPDNIVNSIYQTEVSNQSQNSSAVTPAVDNHINPVVHNEPAFCNIQSTRGSVNKMPIKLEPLS